MAGPSTKTTAAKRAPAERTPAAPAPTDERDALSLTDLASGILSKAIRPRTGDIRRLAEAVIAGGSTKPKKAKKAPKADGGGGKKDKGKKNKKKLAKIPGQSKN